jgi:enhancing lycopene biosynthesis protein 2
MTIGVLLAGSGVYDGSEIHEATFTLLAIAQAGHTALCMAPNKLQAHVVNHLTGEEMPEQRNVLVESARIARGDIRDVTTVVVSELDGLVIPGGFGAAKNLNRWAFEGPAGAIDAEVRRLIVQLVEARKPIAALCMGPTVLAKALEGTDVHAWLTVGTTSEASEYDIAAISSGIEALGHTADMKTVREITVDRMNRFVSAPCYMMEAGIDDVYANVKQAVQALIELTYG